MTVRIRTVAIGNLLKYRNKFEEFIGYVPDLGDKHKEAYTLVSSLLRTDNHELSPVEAVKQLKILLNDSQTVILTLRVLSTENMLGNLQYFSPKSILTLTSGYSYFVNQLNVCVSEASGVQAGPFFRAISDYRSPKTGVYF